MEKDRAPGPTQFVELQAELLVLCLLGEAVLLGTSWLVKHRQDTHAYCWFRKINNGNPLLGCIEASE